ncbi:FAD-dependent oxidoreductase [Escherichia coli]
MVYGARDPDDVERLVVPKLLKTFPQLKGAKIDYRWTGQLPPTLSRMPQFGRLDTNIYYMQGYSGHGDLTHLAGRLIAELCAATPNVSMPSPICRIARSPAGARCVCRLPRWARRITACAIVWRLISD